MAPCPPKIVGQAVEPLERFRQIGNHGEGLDWFHGCSHPPYRRFRRLSERLGSDFKLTQVCVKRCHQRPQTADIVVAGRLLDRQTHLCQFGNAVGPSGSFQSMAEDAYYLELALFQTGPQASEIDGASSKIPDQ